MARSVLVIDDEEGIARALAIRLRAAGFEVETACSGMAGLAAAASHPPDLILLDVRMPDIDGFEVHARLRRDPVLANIPVIFLSASVQDSARQSALAAGAIEYVTKPYDARQLIASINRAIDVLSPGHAPPATPHTLDPTHARN